MPKTREQKAQILKRLCNAFRQAKSVVFADYQGLTVSQADELRKKARAAHVEYIVSKKTLLTRAAADAGFSFNVKQLPGMLGAAFGIEDEIAPAKILGDFGKHATIKLVGGIFEGAPVGAEKILALSKLPSRQELFSQVVGTIAAPLSAFVRAVDAIKRTREYESVKT